MRDIDTGGTAFPIKSPMLADSFGMTLRDYFAAKAMQASLASPEFMVIVTADEALGSNARERIATVAYRFADAMIEAIIK